MKKKQTAVEWLFEQMPKKLHPHYKKQFEQANKMFEEQIMDAALELNPGNIPPKLVKELAEQYYNETFKSE